MTELDMDAVIGKARREYREAKREMEALRAKANQVSQFAIKLENALSDPSLIRFFDGRPMFTMPGAPPRHFIVFTEAEFSQVTPSTIKQFGESFRNLEGRIEALRKQLIDLEGEDPEHGRLQA